MLETLAKCLKVMDEIIEPIDDLGYYVSRSTEHLSGGLVLSGWAGMMVTRIVLMDSCRILVTGGSISAPPNT